MKSNMTERTHDVYRRTWFCVYLLDKFIGLIMGRPSCIRDGEWDTTFPEWSKISLGNYDKSVDFAGIEKAVEFWGLMGEISQIGNKVASSEQEVKSTIQAISIKMAQFKQSLPPCVQNFIKGNLIAGEPWAGRHLIALSYNAVP
jgi:hypothetical protein